MVVFLSILWVVLVQTVHHCDRVVKAADLPSQGFYRNKQIKQGVGSNYAYLSGGN